MANLKKTMFREYDLRGQVNSDELNESSMEIIAKAYGTMLRNRGIADAVLGYDYRSYSESLAQAVITGLRATGINIINLGYILTPMMYAAQYHFKTKGGVMITASHNPNGWSGVKLALNYSHTLVPDEMRELYELTVSEKFVQGKGKLRTDSYFEAYTKDLLSRASIKRKIRVVLNTGNGGAGDIVPKILEQAGVEVIGLYNALDWSFSHYTPNPSKVEMMEDTANKVKETGAHIGIAIDADGDRLGVTDEKGEIIWPDRYLILLSRLVLKKVPGAPIVFDVKCSQALEEDIAAHGGKPIMWKTGHSYIKAKLTELDAPLGGEMSGHIFFGKPLYYGFDDAVFATLKLLEYIAKENKPLSEIMRGTPNYLSSPALQVHCADEVKYQVVDKLTQEFKKEGYEVIDINGARVKFPDGWGLVRASSNLPVLVLRFEAKTQPRLNEVMNLFKEKFTKYPEIGKEWESG